MLGDGIWRVGRAVLKRTDSTDEPPDPPCRPVFERMVLRHLLLEQIPVAMTIATDTGELAVQTADGWWVLMGWLCGSLGVRPPVANAPWNSPSGLVRAEEELGDERLFRAYGAAIGRCHAALASFRAEAVPAWVPTDKPCLFVVEQVLPALAAEPAGSAAAELAALVATGRPAAALAEAVAAAAAGIQLVHRDMHAGNLLLHWVVRCGISADDAEDNEPHYRLAGVVDWDHLCLGSPVFDLAYFANQLGKWVAVSGDRPKLQRWEQSVR